MYTYSILSISKSNKWIYIKCNEEDNFLEHEPFIELVKSITKKWNNGTWEGNISSAGEMRYKIKNDPLNLIYQWDDCFGIVFEYDNKNIEEIQAFILENYQIR